MPEEILPAGGAPDLTATNRAYEALVATPLIHEEGEDFGYWAPAVALLRRLGATSFRRLGDGIGVGFRRFAVESQIYDTRTVVAMSATVKFKLSEAVGEKRAFSIMLSACAYDGYSRSAGACDVGFGPLPESEGSVDGIDLARRYAVVLAGLLEKHPKLAADMPRGIDTPTLAAKALLP